ncbi:zinc finger MYM-type protein 1-like [Macrosteles quadrilineatus]|uniref:zinc finger MYM-type protein 1-like n=1 Tax=Macrosteles quadrilineatus TaxID=74068 RepID=UPI0023E139F6|nr:zinc finger MYM-type protein 1-like [Macrosteles quadrilineatus]
MAQTVEKNRETLKTLVRSALFCARQGIALRGHREVQPGKAHEDPDDSDDSNDLLEDRPENAASNVVTRSIVNEIKSSNIYSIIVDEARDEGKKEQMSICCRYIHQAKIKERFLGFVELQELTAESLAIKILSFLESNGLDIKNCVSQSFDGASAMSGKLNGVQTLIREMAKNPCPYVHCHAHRLNLVLVDVAKNVQIVRETIGLLEAIYAFQSSSTLRHKLFIFFKETKTGKKSITVPQHSDTRWVAKYKGVEFFKNNLDSVINALKKCTESSKPREAAEARGLLIQIQSFNVTFTLVSLEGVLKIVNILSKQLQSSTIDVGKCRKLVKATRDQLEELRSDAKFESFFQETAQLCNDCEIDHARARDTGRRKQNPTASLEDYFVMETTGKGRYTQKENPKTTLKAEYFHILDNMICEMDKRFAENDISIACISACNPKSHDVLDPKVLCNFSELHGKDCDFTSTLKVQCDLGKTMFKDSKSSMDVLNDLSNFPSFDELKQVMTIVLTMPVSTATAERSFSTMRRIKSNLRATMMGRRLHSLGVLSIEKEASLELLNNPDPVIDEFASQKGRRLQCLTGRAKVDQVLTGLCVPRRTPLTSVEEVAEALVRQLLPDDDPALDTEAQARVRDRVAADAQGVPVPPFTEAELASSLA